MQDSQQTTLQLRAQQDSLASSMRRLQEEEAENARLRSRLQELQLQGEHHTSTIRAAEEQDAELKRQIAQRDRSIRDLSDQLEKRRLSGEACFLLHVSRCN